MKKCSTCHEIKSLDQFNKLSKASDGLQYRCRPCARKWYEANMESHKARTKLQKAEMRKTNRQFIWDYLSTHPCVDCGETDPIVLQFDHVRGDKTKNVSAMNSVGIKTLTEEIAKCDIRCANCHMRKTAKDFGWYAVQLASLV